MTDAAIKERIIDHLAVGEKNARKGEEIAKVFGITRREFQDLTRAERLQGAPIIANSRGYYIPETIDEWRRYISRLYKEAREIRKVAETMKKNIELLEKSKELKTMADAMNFKLSREGIITNDKNRNL